VYYHLSIAQKLLRSDSWTTGDRNIALLLAGLLCILFADPDWERVALPPLCSALPASLAALPTSQSASWWLGAYILYCGTAGIFIKLRN